MTTRRHPHDPEEFDATIGLYEGKIAELESALAESRDKHLRQAGVGQGRAATVGDARVRRRVLNDRVAVKRDYYEVLGVGRQASPDELKRAFRKIAMDSHPDRNPGDAAASARFKEASEAYSVLSDPERRRSYDLFGHSAASAGGSPVDFSDMPFGDIFDTFFGGGFGGRSRRQASNRGDDLRYDMSITFEESFTGVEKEIEIPRLAICQHCSGSGAEPGSGQETCPGCGGSGEIRRAAQSLFGQVVTRAVCPTCGGAGRILRNPCSACGGDGRVQTVKRLSVRIPAGVDMGSQIRLSGEGQAG